MNNLLKAEFYKLIHSWSFWGMILISLILGSILLMDTSRLTENLWNASLYNTPLLYFLTIILAALFIGGDFENRTLHCFVSAGHKRSAILLAKTISYLAASVVILSVPLLFHGSADIVMGNKSRFTGGFFLTEIAVILIVILSMTMLPLLCALIFKDIGKALAVPMMLYFLTIFVLNSSYAKNVSIILPMGQLRLLSLNELPVSELSVIGIDILWIVILYMGAYVNFCHADLK